MLKYCNIAGPYEEKSAYSRLSPVVATENISHLIMLSDAKHSSRNGWSSVLRRSAQESGDKRCNQSRLLSSCAFHA